ncbi:hypothetical protein BC831DRAFT_480125 [Entophlyctis helioformis]|nr:hypothetical protein BC831DRAFT_480125 [Entophlyctis helioformis]
MLCPHEHLASNALTVCVCSICVACSNHTLLVCPECRPVQHCAPWHAVSVHDPLSCVAMTLVGRSHQVDLVLTSKRLCRCS